MKPHCIHMVKYVLPAIRAMVAKELIEKGYKIKEVAEMLGLTQAAVSQYLASKRGRRGLEFLEKNEEVRKIVTEIVEVVSREGDVESEEYLCKICEAIRLFKNEQKY